MSEKKTVARLTPSGRLIITDPDLVELVGRLKGAELWHTPVDQGLAVHFTSEDKPGRIGFELGPAGSGEIHLEAGAFLDKVGLPRPEAEKTLAVTSLNAKQLVLSLRLGPAKEIKFAPGEVLKSLGG